jgi:FKBP-type peptidyl-prolyl cis-trans isomerase 2
MPTAQQGDTVQVHYTARLEDGTVFDSSRDRDPIEFTLGQDEVIPGFQHAVEGLSEGETASARIPPEEGFGKRSDELVMTVPREQLPGVTDPSIGQKLELTTGDGYKIPVRVTGKSDSTVQIDANHPLAGRALEFDLELVKIV